MSRYPTSDDNPFSEEYDVEPAAAAPPKWQQEGDATGGLIPYKNAPALMAYYLGVFSLIPCVGLFLAVPAFVLGVVGLRAYYRNPVVKGSVHAWIGIIAGAIFTLLWGGLMLLGVIGALTNS